MEPRPCPTMDHPPRRRPIVSPALAMLAFSASLAAQEWGACEYQNAPANQSVGCLSQVPAVPVVTALEGGQRPCTVTFSERTESSPTACKVIVRTWVAEDSDHGTKTHTQRITVLDKTGPALSTFPLHPQAACGGPPPAVPAVTATDSCDGAVPVQVKESTGEDEGCIGENLVRTFTAQDACGNVTTGQQIVSWLDSTPPRLVGVPPNAELGCDERLPAAPTVTAQDACDSAPKVEMTEVKTPGNCPGRATLTRTWTARDRCGQTATASQVLTIVDNKGPQLVGVPPNAVLGCNERMPPPPTVTANDNCPGPTPLAVKLDEQKTGDGCGAQIVRTWSTADLCGNQASARQTIAVTGGGPPIFANVPPPVTIECGQPLPAASPAASSPCDPAPRVTYAEAFAPGPCPGTKVVTRTWTATDRCGQSATASQVVTYQDRTAPVITGAPPDVAVECGKVPAPPQLTATDACGGPVPVTVADAPGPGCGGIVRTFTAKDACGNVATARQTITVRPGPPPAFTGVPPDATVECGAVPPAPSVRASSACDPSPRIDFKEDKVATSCASVFTLNRIWTATDRCGATATARQVVTVKDTRPPVISGVPPDAAAECGTSLPPAAATARDACDGNLPVAVYDERAPGNCADAATVTRTFTARDCAGNAATARQVVTVRDSTRPVLTGVPSDVTVECGRIPPPATVTARDNCDPGPLAVQAGERREPGNCASRFRVIRNWSTTDRCGNAIQAAQTITSVDNTPPAITPGGDLACLWPPNHWYVCMTPEELQPQTRVVDNCGPEGLTWRFTSCQSDQPDDDADDRDTVDGGQYKGDGNTRNDCVVDPQAGRWACMRAERAGSNPAGRRYSLGMAATDACGNASPPVAVGRVYVPHNGAAPGCLKTTQVGCNDNQPIPCLSKK